MPQLGFGTWGLSPLEARTAVAQAIGIGYRLIDTAEMYDNEEGVGLGLRDSGIPREELFVTTKLPGGGHGVQEAQDSLARSLERLGLDYVDLYLVHWPLPRQNCYVDAWRGLISLREQGLARAIGVSNFKPAHVERTVSDTGVIPDVNQIQLNPYVARDVSRAYDSEHGIVTQSWSPLGLGVHALLAEQSGASSLVLEDPVIVRIADEHGKHPAQVVLRWHMDLGLSLVTKSTNVDRMAQNLDVFDFALEPEQLAAISALDRGEAAAADSDAPSVGG
jgi:2,5-diketo-D-gluconate reductase A